VIDRRKGLQREFPVINEATNIISNSMETPVARERAGIGCHAAGQAHHSSCFNEGEKP